jgi:hypothetical protein
MDKIKPTPAKAPTTQTSAPTQPKDPKNIENPGSPTIRRTTNKQQNKPLKPTQRPLLERAAETPPKTNTKSSE